MKKFLLFFVLLLVTVSSFAGDRLFVLKGEIAGIEKGDAFLLVQLDKERKPVSLDTIRIVQDGVLSYQKELNNDFEGQLLYCKNGEIPKQNKKRGGFWSFPSKCMLITGGDSFLNGDISQGIQRLMLSGDAYSERAVAFMKLKDSLEYQTSQLYQKGVFPSDYQGAKGKNGIYECVQMLQDKETNAVLDFVKEDNGSAYSAYELYSIVDMITMSIFKQCSWYRSKEDLQVFCNRLTPEAKNSTFGLLLSDFIGIKNRLENGRKAPDFKFTDVDGHVMSLKDFRGKVVVLYFYSSSCPGCKECLPYLKEMYDAYPKDKFEIIGVYCDEDKDDTKLLRLAAKDQAVWRKVRGNATKSNSKMIVDYHISCFPTGYLISADGILLNSTAIQIFKKIIDKENYIQ